MCVSLLSARLIIIMHKLNDEDDDDDDYNDSRCCQTLFATRQPRALALHRSLHPRRGFRRHRAVIKSDICIITALNSYNPKPRPVLGCPSSIDRCASWVSLLIKVYSGSRQELLQVLCTRVINMSPGLIRDWGIKARATLL